MSLRVEKSSSTAQPTKIDSAVKSAYRSPSAHHEIFPSLAQSFRERLREPPRDRNYNVEPFNALPNSRPIRSRISAPVFTLPGSIVKPFFEECPDVGLNRFPSPGKRQSMLR